MRKSPVRHIVHPKHNRYSVSQYPRGQGKHSPVTVQRRGGFIDIDTEAQLQKLQVAVKSRKKWIVYMWRWKHKGRVDFNIRAKSKIPAENLWDYHNWFANSNQPTSDLVDRYGLDRPRKDVLKFKSPPGNNVYVGSGSDKRRTKLGFATRRILRNQFTDEEIRAMGTLFLEGSSPKRGALGSCSYYTNYGNNYILIRQEALDDDKVITHELIHARRFGMNESPRDRDKMEKMVELETTCRIPLDSIKRKDTHGGGYYQHVPSVKRIPYWKDRAGYEKAVRDAMIFDRKAVMGDENRVMKGKALRERVTMKYHLTQIAKAHFSPAELLDRYFIVKDEGISSKVHIRYEKPPTVAQIKSDFIQEYGKDVEVWELQDGKKVKFLTPSGASKVVTYDKSDITMGSGFKCLYCKERFAKVGLMYDHAISTHPRAKRELKYKQRTTQL